MNGWRYEIMNKGYLRTIIQNKRWILHGLVASIVGVIVYKYLSNVWYYYILDKLYVPPAAHPNYETIREIFIKLSFIGSGFVSGLISATGYCLDNKIYAIRYVFGCGLTYLILIVLFGLRSVEEFRYINYIYLPTATITFFVFIIVFALIKKISRSST